MRILKWYLGKAKGKNLQNGISRMLVSIVGCGSTTVLLSFLSQPKTFLLFGRAFMLEVYLLKKAASTINQTASREPLLNANVKEHESSNVLSVIAGSESSTTNTTSYDIHLNFMISPGNFSNEAETNSSFYLSTIEKWTNISLPTSLPKAYLGTEHPYLNESEVPFPNETYHNADFLHESWWNVFDERYLRHGWGWTITLIIAYMLILVVGIIGNLMVILVVVLRPQMRTVTNMFIMNLAVADILVIVFCVPSTLLANIFAPWILGSFMCKAVAYVQGVSVCASGYSLAAISLDRCQAIYRNYERPRGFSQTICIRTVFVVWAAALFLTIPWAVVFEVKISEYDGLRYCVETWTVQELGDIYFLLVNLVGSYAIPLVLIFVSNWIIYCHVTHRTVPQHSASSDPITKLHRHTRHVVLRMLGIVTLTFLFSWLPIYILVIIIKFSETMSESKYNALGILMPIAQWLGNWNSSINPILYAFLNKKFRHMFASLLPAWIPVKAAGKYVGSMGTPSFTTSAYAGRSFRRSRTNSRSDYHRNHQSVDRNSLTKANIIMGRFYEPTGTVAASTMQIISTTLPATVVLISGSLENIFDTAVAEIITTEIITDL